MKKNKRRDTVIEHLIQPFDIPFPKKDKSYISSGFCESDESTTIFRRTLFEGESDVCEVECSLCGGPVITYKHSSLLSSTYTPEILGCLIQRNKTLLFVVETALTQSDLKTVEGVLLAFLARHDFSKSFQRISVYHSGVNSSLLKKLPPKRSLQFSRKLKSISEETKGELDKQGLEDQGVSNTFDKEEQQRREDLAKSAAKLLKELEKLSMLPVHENAKISSNQTQISQKTSRNSSEKLSKAEGISLRKSIKDFVMKDSLYE